LTDPWRVKGKKTRVFVNPVYERGVLIRWCRKAYEEFLEDYCELVVMLLPLRKTGISFLARRKADIEFRIIEERLHFSGAKLGAPFDSVVAVIR